MVKRDVRAAFRGHMVDGEKSRKICSILMEDEDVKSAEVLFLYHPLPDEVDIKCLYNAGHKVALPFMKDRRDMGFALYDGTLVKGRLDIMEPEGRIEVFPTGADLMIVPAVAYTRDGRRVGRGLGCYDRYLAEHSVRTIGVVSAERIVPVEDIMDFDVKVDRLLTEEGFLSL